MDLHQDHIHADSFPPTFVGRKDNLEKSQCPTTGSAWESLGIDSANRLFADSESNSALLTEDSALSEPFESHVWPFYPRMSVSLRPTLLDVSDIENSCTNPFTWLNSSETIQHSDLSDPDSHKSWQLSCCELDTLFPSLDRIGIDSVYRGVGAFLPQATAQVSNDVTLHTKFPIGSHSQGPPPISAFELQTSISDTPPVETGFIEQLSAQALIPTTSASTFARDPTYISVTEKNKLPRLSSPSTQMQGATRLCHGQRRTVADSSEQVLREPNSKDWDLLRPITCALYSKLTLSQVKEVLKSKYGFKTR